MNQINTSLTAMAAVQSGCGCIDGSNPTGARTLMQGGEAVFENDNYRITAGDNNTVAIHNKHTGETYQAWGDPHMKIDGKDTFDFWGTTSVRLEDGTQVTIETTPSQDNPETTLSSRVTITSGDYGVRISGIDTNKPGDLKIDEAKGYGQVLDALVSDGNMLHENPAGRGFVAVDKHGDIRAVDQDYINQTDLKKGGALQDKYREAFGKLSSLISIAFTGAFLGNLPKPGHEGSRDCHRPRPDPCPDQGRSRNGIMWPGGTPPWIFDETIGGPNPDRGPRPGALFRGAEFLSLRVELTMARMH